MNGSQFCLAYDRVIQEWIIEASNGVGLDSSR